MVSPPALPGKKPLPVVKLAVVAGCLLCAAVLILRGVDLMALKERAMGLMRDAGPVVFFGAMLLLPAAGVPMLAFTIPAGEAYAPQLGLTGVLVLTLVILALNLALIYWLARFALRPVLLGLMKRYGYSVPRVTPENALTVILVVRLTGSPYAVQGYILGLAETPFRIYMIASWLCVLPWSAGAVVLGKGIMNGNFKLVGIGLAVLAVAVVTVQLLRRKFAKRAS